MSNYLRMAIAASMMALLACFCISSANAQIQILYSAKAITGRIVDAETGEPLSGVNIVALWRIDRKWVGDEKSLLKIMETVSDKDGHYDFPAWGPITLPLLANFSHGKDPIIWYFKHGYWPEHAQNDATLEPRFRTPPPGEFKWNGEAIKLRKWDGKNVNLYEFAVSTMSDFTYDSVENEKSAYRSYPRMLITLMEEDTYLRKLGGAGIGKCASCMLPEKLEFLDRLKRQ